MLCRFYITFRYIIPRLRQVSNYCGRSVLLGNLSEHTKIRSHLRPKTILHVTVDSGVEAGERIIPIGDT